MLRKLFGLLTLSLLLTASSFAQDDVVDSDTADVIEQRKHQDLFYVDLTWDYLLGLPEGVEQKWYGRGVNLGLVYDQPFTKDGMVSGAIGAGFASHNYYLNALVNRFDSAGSSYSKFQVASDSVLSRGKISLNYVDVPFELRFRTKPNKEGIRWKFAVGGKVGYLVNVHEKIIDAQDIKIKTYNYPNIAQVRYGVSARVAYGAIGVSAFYSLSPLFNAGSSVGQQNSFAVAISLIPF